ncbi:beta-lactamase family protein [Spirosoma aureum]|uniref:Beta-lactamase family protein n=1 Tax=Spirosoma aureum TaxID=2692134 RepID=A0A6G9AYE9_9BACT|nr:serine hydrolase domain-containing protein [Spirosoma aureum]QIP17315.1 beta-lactamase family protein [Spirosoma aureum]
MKHLSMFALVVLLILGSATLESCVQDHLPPTNVQPQLQQLTDSLYQHLNQQLGIEKNKGGLFLQVNSPAGSNLVSTNIESGVQANSHFRIASLSKIFTAAAIMLLEQQGKLNINQFIPAYLPATPAYDILNKDKITIKQLLQHRAGVFDVTNQEIPETVNQPYAKKNYVFYVREDLKQDTHTFTFDELVGVVAQNKLSNFTPGTTFGYSNTGYNLLGKIIEIASGMSYSEFIRTQFLEPLQLTNTYGVWQGTDNRMKDPFINSYLYVPGQPVEATPEDNMSMHVTEGDMVSTPADITRWIELLMTGKAGLTPQTVARMQEMEVADVSHGVYGLGITFNEGLGFGHDGAHLSFVSTLRYNPANKTTVLMVANFIAIGGPPANPNANFLEVAFGVRYTALRAAQIVNR